MLQLHRTEYEQFANMSEYIEGDIKLVKPLSDIGKNVDDDEVAEILLSGLPQEFDALVSSLETASLTKTLTSELVRTRLLQEDHRRNENKKHDGTSTYTVKGKNVQSTIICNYCKKPNHTFKKCFKRKRDLGILKRKMNIQCLLWP